ncbi:sodium:solute symporter [Fulvivirga sedimenti]|uniref:Sodium:solute symporter n=1 Tax=Fulvivirga sedimenti TaxID=2879465 RepID=A0A9X1HPV2_9BACT|nr:sodium:solute symporter [Fulvivirga sedimenti]MCA6074558.1 sodium:solute symporter [Fulvivirga sedimenti]MCA6075735.1 sodium:solute symporter [Fulvivirga sedimenti]MCA6076863.1 sodium:solute symporter [Fulvivirga sedimenti]
MNTLDYTIVILYAIGFLGLGYFFKQQNNKEDYFLGGRSFGWFPLSLSVMATQLSAISFMSAPAFVGIREGGGLQWLSYEFAVPLAMIFLATVLIPALYRSGVVSIYEYLEKRFGISTRLLLSLVFQISRAFATAVMIYAVALIIMSVIGIPFWQTILVIGLVTLIYSYQGGMKAVVYGDMIQMIILFGGILICLYYGLDLLGGWSQFTELVETDRLTAVDFGSLGFAEGESFGFWPMLFGGFFLYASYYGTDQSQVQRLLAADSLATVKKTLFYNGLLRFPITLSYCIMGLIVGVFAMNTPEFIAQIPADKPDLMIPVFIRDYLPHGIIGILIVAILSAAMSSLSSAINSLSAVTTEDFVLRGKSVPPDRYVRYSRMTSLFWGLVCIGLSFYAGDIAPTVIEAINKIGSVFFGPILATFLVAIRFKRVGAFSMNTGLLTGVGVNIFMWLVVGNSIFWFWWNAIGFFVSLLVALLISAFRSAPSRDEASGDTLEPLLTRMNLGLIIYFVAIVSFSIALRYMF